ncbi:MAG: YbaB/EbfC family nucleoid-associated protein [Nocardioides sp.]
MTDTPSGNPFDALGGGGFDMSALLQQAQQLQQQLQEAQESLAETTVDGEVAGGAVVVSVSGVGDLQRVTIRPGTVDGGDESDLADLSDLIVAAYRDAKTKADALAAETMGPLAGGMGGGSGEAAPGLGGGFGLPPGLG